MKHMRIVLAPKKVIAVLAAVLLTSSSLLAGAQHKVLAYNTVKPGTTAVKAVSNDEPNIQITQLEKDALLFKLTIENPAAEKLTLVIKDYYNNTLHRENLPATSKYEGRFNLQSLEDGQYTFEIRSGKNKIAEKAVGIRTQTMVNRNVSVQ